VATILADTVVTAAKLCEIPHGDGNCVSKKTYHYSTYLPVTDGYIEKAFPCHSVNSIIVLYWAIRNHWGLSEPKHWYQADSYHHGYQAQRDSIFDKLRGFLLFLFLIFKRIDVDIVLAITILGHSFFSLLVSSLHFGKHCILFSLRWFWLWGNLKAYGRVVKSSSLIDTHFKFLISIGRKAWQVMILGFIGALHTLRVHSLFASFDILSEWSLPIWLARSLRLVVKVNINATIFRLSSRGVWVSTLGVTECSCLIFHCT